MEEKEFKENQCSLSVLTARFWPRRIGGAMGDPEQRQEKSIMWHWAASLSSNIPRKDDEPSPTQFSHSDQTLEPGFYSSSLPIKSTARPHHWDSAGETKATRAPYTVLVAQGRREGGAGWPFTPRGSLCSMALIGPGSTDPRRLTPLGSSTQVPGAPKHFWGSLPGYECS